MQIWEASIFKSSKGNFNHWLFTSSSFGSVYKENWLLQSRKQHLFDMDTTPSTVFEGGSK